MLPSTIMVSCSKGQAKAGDVPLVILRVVSKFQVHILSLKCYISWIVLLTGMVVSKQVNK